MVDIHNFLNEGSWQEILRWENKYHCECQDIRLNSFKGRPNDLSPKAWFYSTIYRGPKPFDRHDWFVDRCGREVRYVIDYYSGDKDTTFHVDVRPALDSPSAIFDRVRQSFSDFFK
jgi:cytochrome c heme-lyase